MTKVDLFVEWKLVDPEDDWNWKSEEYLDIELNDAVPLAKAIVADKISSLTDIDTIAVEVFPHEDQSADAVWTMRVEFEDRISVPTLV